MATSKANQQLQRIIPANRREITNESVHLTFGIIHASNASEKNRGLDYQLDVVRIRSRT
jgi:hypothetical protein